MEANKPCNSGFSLSFFPLADRRSHFLWLFENPNQPAKFFIWQVFIVDTKLLAVKYNELFIPAALEIFDRFQIFFQFIGNSGLGCTLTVLFMGFSNIPDNEAEVIQNHVAEIFIITDMGGLQHFQMGVVFAGAIPFNDFMPASIAKTLSVLQGEKPVLIVTEGTAKLDNHKYKSLFHIKAKMIPYDEVEAYVGHAPGGVCPFGVNEGVAVYLDESLRKFDTVYPAAGNGHTAVKLTLQELEAAAGAEGWVDVCKEPEGEWNEPQKLDKNWIKQPQRSESCTAQDSGRLVLI